MNSQTTFVSAQSQSSSSKTVRHRFLRPVKICQKSILFCLSLFLSVAVQAETLKIYTEEWAPYNFTKDNEIVGISTDLVIAMLERAGYSYEINLMPFARGIRNVTNTPGTMLYTVNRSPQREHLFKWVGPLYNRQVFFFKLKSRTDIQVKQIEDLHKYFVGVLSGGSVEVFLLSNGFTENQLLRVSETSQLHKMLFSHRLDLIPADSTSFHFSLIGTENRFQDAEPVYRIGGRDAYYIAVNLNTPDEVVNRLQSALDELIAEDIREKILQKYLTEE